MIKAGRSSCQSVTTDFRSPSNTPTISDIIGIPDRERVEIRCECMDSGETLPEWNYDKKDVPDSPRHDDEPYVDTDMTQVILRVDSFEEDSSGLYACHGSNREVVEFNLAWYDPGELAVRYVCS